MADVSKYIDQYGLPGTRDYRQNLDMGDSAAIFFNIVALSNEIAESHCGMYFDEEHKKPVRHPDASKWWGQPDRFSRDQLIPVLCWAILQDKSDRSLVKKVFISHLKRGLLFAWNSRKNGEIDTPWKMPDITALEIWGLWLRVFKPPGYQLLLPICDLETLAGAINWKFQPETNQITRNHMLIALAQRTHPSIVSRMSDKLNNYPDLVARWERNVAAVGEYPTADLFKQKLLG